MFTEAHAALVAGQTSLPQVDGHVVVEDISACEALSAACTGKGLLSSMHLDVSPQVPLEVEGASALWAGVRSIPAVDAHVRLQAAFPGETLSTQPADEGLLPAVDDQVQLQVPPVAEALPTLRTAQTNRVLALLRYCVCTGEVLMLLQLVSLFHVLQIFSPKWVFLFSVLQIFYLFLQHQQI